MKKITIGGIVTLIVILASGTTYYIQDLGTKTGCRAGWEYIDNGEYEGYYGCTTSSGIRHQICFDVYNSTNTEKYWCKKGVLIESEAHIKLSLQSTDGEWICPKRPNPCIKQNIGGD